ncbi:MAG: hypothetical protein JRH20_03790 [Deltaproteobacteria bacterium]|nr:hypothetical protein [Deltaproteobacteria bacterium]
MPSALSLPAPLPRDRTRRVARVGGALVALMLTGFFVFQGARIAQMPTDKITAWNVIIDDGFYYLQVARNIARGRGSTFDRLNPTNGYQPLWALTLVPIFWLTNNTHLAVQLVLLLATALGGAAILLFYAALLRLAGLATALIATTLFATNPYFLQLLQGGLETPVLFVCLASLTLFWAHRGSTLLLGRRKPALLFGLLMGLTVLARVDVLLLLLPLGLAIALWPGASMAPRLSRTLWTAAGAGLVLAPYVAWNVIAHGALVPVSGLVKRWVVATYQPTHELFLRTEQWRGLARTTDLLSWPHGLHEGQRISSILPALAYPAAMLLFLFARLAWRRQRQRPQLMLALGGAMVVGVACHTAYLYFIYRSCSHWNYHYFFPLALLWTLLFATAAPALIGDLARGVDRLLGRFAVFCRAQGILALVLCLPLIASCWHLGGKAARKHANYVHQHPGASFRLSRFQAAEVLRRDFPKDPVFGAWWAGTLGYFSDRRVVNLDGVINSRDYLERYLKTDKVPTYIEEGPITYLVDFFWRDPLAKGFRPSPRAFFWEHDKEHIIKRLHGKLKQVRRVPFRGGGMFVLKVRKPAKAPFQR